VKHGGTSGCDPLTPGHQHHSQQQQGQQRSHRQLEYHRHRCLWEQLLSAKRGAGGGGGPEPPLHAVDLGQVLLPVPHVQDAPGFPNQGRRLIMGRGGGHASCSKIN
jgi:hypothetical protein